jgi:hypothetical protein
MSYQWFSNTENNNTSGSLINGATGISYIPPTTTTGTRYYYVVVTNTNNSASGTKTATTTSNTAEVTVQQATSVEIADASPARVYPNPTAGAVTLQFETAGEYVITITDITGKILLRQTASDQTVRLYISHFPVGAYLLTIDDGKRQSVVRVVKE